MSILTHWADKSAPLHSPRRHAPFTLIFWAAFGALLSAAVALGEVVAKAANLIAENRMHRALVEAELYLNRYSHISKNDDDLPVVRPTAATGGAPPEGLGFIAAVKRAYPVILVFAIFAVLLTATIALRMIIWLPM